MWATQALAQSANVQAALFPPFVVVADELALDFDNCRTVASQQVGATWSEAQRCALAGLDRMLEETNGRHELVSLEHPFWDQVRRRARTVLTAFGWPPDPPPQDRAAYVPTNT